MSQEVDNKNPPELQQEKYQQVYQPPQLIALESIEAEGGLTNVVENNSGVLLNS
ncbi:MAG: hypothetical protein K0U37_07745 [Gammaproteobacteria bacterium]|nr:hypothetical protein [Gammaproteobacteria bacterium]